MGGLGVGALGAAGGVLAAEVCAPLLLLCWLCCWPDDDRSDSSSEKHPQNPVISNESGSRRSNDLFGRRFASSAVSLHNPSTSGHTKQSLSAHRSHEEIRSRRKSQLEPADQDSHYHSAPSVIDEVIHRRDWERSTKDLYIPLKSDNEFSNASDASDKSDKDDSDENAHSLVVRTCKKHYTNIKSSRKKEPNKESLNDDIKDKDATEGETNFYIGDASAATSPHENSNELKVEDEAKKSYKVKEAKQCLNESIRSKDRKRQPLVPLTEFQVAGFDRVEDEDLEIDRSGAMHHGVESRSSLYNTHNIPAPPPSVDAVGYEWEASYLEESGAAGVWRAPAPGGWARARHASAGDVLAPTRRPQSGALSESDLDYELEGCDDPPPAYDEVELLASLDRKETAI